MILLAWITAVADKVVLTFLRLLLPMRLVTLIAFIGMKSTCYYMERTFKTNFQPVLSIHELRGYFYFEKIDHYSAFQHVITSTAGGDSTI